MDTSAVPQQNDMCSYFPPACIGNISSFTNLIVPILLVGAGVVLLGMLFLGAFKIITAGGNPENIASAKSLFSYALLGFIVIVLSFFFVKVLGFILGISVFI